MTRTTNKKLTLTGAVSLLALSFAAGNAYAQETDFDIEAQPLAKALLDFNEQSGLTVAAPRDLVEGKSAPAVRGEMEPEEALEKILSESGLKSNELPTGAYTITLASAEVTERTPAPFRVAQVDQEDDFRGVNTSDEDDAEARQDVIVVTGTNIRGLAPESSPVVTFTRDDIDASGYTTVEGFLSTLPQNSGAGVGQENFLAPGAGADVFEQGAGVNLRGLGQRSTLVLVNGNRLAPSGISGQFADVSLIPLSAIERVEVLTIGASAIYGSDAVGGVVNFILKDDFDGIEATVRGGTATNGGRNEIQVSPTIGKSWSNGSALLAYEFLSRDEMLAGDRDFTINYGDDSFFLPREERQSVFGRFSQDITASLTFDASVIFATRDTKRDFINSAGLLTNADATSDLFNANAGLTYDFGNSWVASVGANYGKNDGSSLDQTADASLTRDGTTESENYEIDGLLTGDLFELPGGSVKIAFGGQYRNSSFSRDLLANGINTLPIDETLDSSAVFAEAFVPLVTSANRVPGIERLELNAAARFESYGGSIGDTTNPTIGLLWEPTAGLTFSGTYGTSFRAPLPAELGGSYVITVVGSPGFLFADPASPDTMLGDVISISGFDADVQPETSETWTASVAFEPAQVDGLSLSATYFNTDFRDRIERPTSGGVSGTIGNPAFESIVTRNPSLADVQSLFDGADSVSDIRRFFDPTATGPFDLNDAGIFLDSRVSNTSSAKTDGLDLSAAYSFRTGEHSFSVQGAATYLFTFEDQLTPTSPSVDDLDTVFNPPSFTARFGGTWAHSGLTTNIFVNHTDSYEDVRRDPVAKVDSFTTVDVGVSYDFGQNSSGLLSNAIISANVVNLFDEDPPFVQSSPLSLSDVGYDPVNAAGIGRFINFAVRKKF